MYSNSSNNKTKTKQHKHKLKCQQQIIHWNLQYSTASTEKAKSLQGIFDKLKKKLEQVFYYYGVSTCKITVTPLFLSVVGWTVSGPAVLVCVRLSIISGQTSHETHAKFHSCWNKAFLIKKNFFFFSILWCSTGLHFLWFLALSLISVFPSPS